MWRCDHPATAQWTPTTQGVLTRRQPHSGVRLPHVLYSSLRGPASSRPPTQTSGRAPGRAEAPRAPVPPESRRTVYLGPRKRPLSACSEVAWGQPARCAGGSMPIARGCCSHTEGTVSPTLTPRPSAPTERVHLDGPRPGGSGGVPLLSLCSHDGRQGSLTTRQGDPAPVAHLDSRLWSCAPSRCTALRAAGPPGTSSRVPDANPRLQHACCQAPGAVLRGRGLAARRLAPPALLPDAQRPASGSHPQVQRRKAGPGRPSPGRRAWAGGIVRGVNAGSHRTARPARGLPATPHLWTEASWTTL